VALSSSRPHPQYGTEVARVEPLGIERIPSQERHGHPQSVFTLWWGANVELATLTTGVAAVTLFGLGFWQAVVGLAVGNLLGVLVLGALSTYGPRLGVPQLVHSRSAFGFYGNFLPGAFNLIAGALWFAVNTVLGTFALTALFPIAFSLGLLLMVALQVTVAIFGYNMIHAVERWMALLLTLVFVLVSFYGFSHAVPAQPFNPAAPLAKIVGPVGGTVEAIGLAFSYLLGWTVYASDYTRYLPENTSPRAVFGYAATANFLACLWLEVLGVALATIFPKAAAGPDPLGLVIALPSHGLVVLALVAVIVGTLTANVLNIYSASLSALVLNVPLSRWGAALGVGLAGGILAWLGHRSYYLAFENFLFLLAYWLAPWAAVVLVDYFLVHRGRYVEELFYDPRRRLHFGLWAWVGGIALSLPFFNQSLFVGWVASHLPHLGDVSYYVGFVGAALLYWLTQRRLGRR
jgi:NCS1 family nucleobase:cation symporter-1